VQNGQPFFRAAREFPVPQKYKNQQEKVEKQK
jgi:hypothetical protein